MKILCLLSEIFAPGGIQKYNTTLLRALAESQYQVFVLSMNDKNKIRYPLPYAIKACADAPLFRKLKFVWYAFVYSIKFNPDVIICGHINFSPLCFLLCRIFRTDYIVITHGVEVWDLNSPFQIVGLLRAKLILTVSEYTACKIREQLPQIERKIVIIPNSIDGSRFYIKSKSADLVKKYNLANQKVILTVSRLRFSDRIKGYDKVMEVMPKVIKEFPNSKYILVGGGDDEKRLSRLRDSLGLKDKVIFAGCLSEDQLIDYYNLCDVFVMPSKNEGFGIVFLEALACGKPVIAGNKDGSRDALLDGEVGILIDPDNIDEIAKTLIKVLKRDIPAKMLDGEYLRKRVIEEYGFDKFKKKIKEAIVHASLRTRAKRG